MERVIEIQSVNQGMVTSKLLSTGEVLDFPAEESFLKALHDKGLAVFGWQDVLGCVVSLSIPSMVPTRFIANLRQGWLVDEHEPDQYAKILGVEEKVTLFAGDYTTRTVQGLSLGIERKASSDLYASAWGKHKEPSRLSTEIPKLVQSYDLPFLLVCYEGLKCTYDGLLDIPSMGSNLRIRYQTWAALQKILLEYQQMYPSLLLWASANEIRVPSDVKEIKKYADTINHKSQIPRPAIAQGVPIDIGMLTAIKGIDITMATRIMEHYSHSIEALLVGGREGLLKIPGVGPVTASAVMSSLKGEYAKEQG